MEYLIIINLETGTSYIEPAPDFDDEKDYSDEMEVYLSERFGNTSSISWGVVNTLKIEI